MKWLLFLIVTTLPAYLIRFKIGPVPTTALEILLLITTIVWFIKKLYARDLGNFFKNFPRAWLVAIALWVVVAAFQTIISPDLRAALGIWRAYFLEPILFLFVFVDTIKTEKDIRLIFTGLGISALYIGFFAAAQKFFGFPIPAPWQNELRVTSIFEYPNAVGLFLAPLVPLFIGVAIPNHTYSRSLSKGIRSLFLTLALLSFFSVAVLTSLLAIIFAKSEGASVGVAVGLFLLGILWNKKIRTRTMILCAIAILIIFSVPFVRHYLVNTGTFQAWSGRVRVYTWRETIVMLRDHPFFGAGLAGYKTVFAPYHKVKAIEIFMYPHNIILNFWSELGLVGLLIFILIVALFYKDCVRLYRQKGFMLHASCFMMSAMITLIIHGLVDVPYFKNDLAILFWIIIGCMLVLKKTESTIH